MRLRLRSCRSFLFGLAVLLWTLQTSLAQSNETSRQGQQKSARKPHVLIAYYSLSGNTEKLARGVLAGAAGVPASDRTAAPGRSTR